MTANGRAKLGATGGISAVLTSIGTMAVQEYFSHEDAKLRHEGEQVERALCSELLGTMQSQWAALVQQCREDCP